jgi:hypothetical protein
MVVVMAAAMAATPGAQAAPAPGRGAEATVRTFLAAVKTHHARRACALIAASSADERSFCRAMVGGKEIATLRARIEPGAVIRGDHARVVVDSVVRYTGVAEASRQRILLRRGAGGWKIVEGGVPGGDPWNDDPVVDPGPTQTTAALRRLADDELLMLSGNGPMACGLLAPGAPLGGARGACSSGQFSDAVGAAALAVRAQRVTIHRTGDRARLDVTALVRRAVSTTAPPRFRIRSARWTDTLHARRVGGRWRLVKLSRKAYDVLGVPAPADADSAAPTATWPLPDLPSLSERPVPAGCRTPPTLWAARCPRVWGLAGGGTTFAWTDGLSDGVVRTTTRAVVAGVPTGPVVAVATEPLVDEHAWLVQDVAPLADGALVIQEDAADRAVRAIPVGLDGQPRGAAQALAPGVGDDRRGGDPTVVPGPVGAPAATVLLHPTTLATLGPDARPAAPARELPELDDGFLEGNGLDGGGLVVRRPDGTLLAIGLGMTTGSGGDVDVRAIGPDGRPADAAVTQAGDPLGLDALRAAVATDGHVLVAWLERDPRGRALLRAWVVDPDAPLGSAPVTVAALGIADALPGTLAVAVAALPAGGWGIAWPDAETKPGRYGLSAVRLDPAGRPVSPPRRVTTALEVRSGLGAQYAIAGDSVAWVEQPPVGLQQVRAAPLP